MDNVRDEFLWTEKFRPQLINECILPQHLKKTFFEFIAKGIPNLILVGGPGVGKTTVARAMLDQVGCDYIIINGSLSGNIDTLRNEIKAYASTVSLSGGRKYVILDEADYLNPQSTQPALRNFMEEFSTNCGFILTCNFLNRIIEPLHSRCSVINFKIDNKDKPILASQFMDRVKLILEHEKISYNDVVVAELIKKHFPDWRRVINELQRYSSSGEIDAGVLVQISDVSFNQLCLGLKNKEFKTIRRWVAENLDNSPDTLFRKLYDCSNEIIQPQSVPQLVTILADYQYKAEFSSDPEVNLVACLTEIMVSCDFK